MKITYNYNREYFSCIDTEDKAYFLGLLMADGHIQVSKRGYYVQLELNEKDKYLVEKFQVYLGAKNKLYHRVPTRSWKLTISSKQMVQDLVNLGCTPRKSLTLEYPTLMIDDINERHFVRGYFDGDGWLIKNRTAYHLGFVGASSFIKILSERLDVVNRVKPHHITSEISELRIWNKNIIQDICHYMYNDSTVWLERKRKVLGI